MADLCHFIMLFCRCEIAINSVISGRSRKDTIFDSILRVFVFSLFLCEATYIANLRLFVFSSFFRGEVEKTKRMNLASFHHFRLLDPSPRNNEKMKKRKNASFLLFDFVTTKQCNEKAENSRNAFNLNDRTFRIFIPGKII